LVIQKYISGLFTVVAILAVLNFLGLYLLGLKYAILFGIISASFNLIPYFGTWIGAAFPLTFALLTGDSPRLFISVFLMYLVVQFTENNILTPNITGSYVRINPLMTILGIIIGGLVWGVTGMLVVIPFLATIKIIFENIEWLKPIAYLISNDKPVKHGLILKALKKKFENLGRQDAEK
jgi:predicted PurR-regulated permease PerM